MTKDEETHRYDDIINLPTPTLSRPRMSLQARAAQFAPFQALTGYTELTKAAVTDVAKSYEK